jgi:hypothetical protein
MDSSLFTRQIWEGESRFEVFLRGHLWVEHFLERFLEVSAVRPDSLALDRLSWALKLNLCDALESPRRSGASMGQLGTLADKLGR